MGLTKTNRNEYQEYSWGVKGSRCIRLTTLPPSVSWLSRENVGAFKSHNPMGLHGLLQGIVLPFLLFGFGYDTQWKVWITHPNTVYTVSKFSFVFKTVRLD
jgi:hypothetical protein